MTFFFPILNIEEVFYSKYIVLSFMGLAQMESY